MIVEVANIAEFICSGVIPKTMTVYSDPHWIRITIWRDMSAGMADAIIVDRAYARVRPGRAMYTGTHSILRALILRARQDKISIVAKTAIGKIGVILHRHGLIQFNPDLPFSSQQTWFWRPG